MLCDGSRGHNPALKLTNQIAQLTKTNACHIIIDIFTLNQMVGHLSMYTAFAEQKI
jgi:hypothetical protein